MRVSRLMLVTLRDVPAEAEITSHQLLLRGGFIRRVGSGIYAYLPMMWKVLQRITTIIREEMNRAGALETLLPQLHPRNSGSAVGGGGLHRRGRNHVPPGRPSRSRAWPWTTMKR